MSHRSIPTTGRLATRMNADSRTKLEQSLAAYTPTDEWFANPPHPLEVEIGIGNGLALLQRATLQPDWHFLGSEVYLNGLRTLVRHLGQSGGTLLASRMRLSAADARTLLHRLPPSSVSRVLVLFPDPWPKSGHHKRRFIQQQTLESIEKVLKPQGELWVVTDWPDYAYHTISLIYKIKNLKLAQTEPAAADCKPTARLENQLGPQALSQAPGWWAPTKYQAKANAAGRNTWYIKAIKQG